VADAQALMLKLEKLRLVAMERRALELSELERHLLVEAAGGQSDTALVSAYQKHLRTVVRAQRQNTEEMQHQSSVVAQRGAVEKVARNLQKDAEAAERRQAERAELEQIVDGAIAKTSLP
jgi:hypothetical protein